MAAGWFGPPGGDCRCACPPPDPCNCQQSDITFWLKIEVSGFPSSLEYYQWCGAGINQFCRLWGALSGLDALNGTYMLPVERICDKETGLATFVFPGAGETTRITLAEVTPGGLLTDCSGSPFAMGEWRLVYSRFQFGPPPATFAIAIEGPATLSIGETEYMTCDSDYHEYTGSASSGFGLRGPGCGLRAPFVTLSYSLVPGEAA